MHGLARTQGAIACHPADGTARPRKRSGDDIFNNKKEASAPLTAHARGDHQPAATPVTHAFLSRAVGVRGDRQRTLARSREWRPVTPPRARSRRWVHAPVAGLATAAVRPRTLDNSPPNRGGRSAGHQSQASASGLAAVCSGWSECRFERFGCIRQQTASLHLPPLGVRPDVRTGVAPEIEELLGNRGKPDSHARATRAREVADDGMALLNRVPPFHERTLGQRRASRKVQCRECGQLRDISCQIGYEISALITVT